MPRPMAHVWIWLPFRSRDTILTANQVMTICKICNGHARTIGSESVSDWQSNSRRRCHFTQMITSIKGKPGAAKFKRRKSIILSRSVSDEFHGARELFSSDHSQESERGIQQRGLFVSRPILATRSRRESHLSNLRQSFRLNLFHYAKVDGREEPTIRTDQGVTKRLHIHRMRSHRYMVIFS
jgi:hypothetical protein